MTTRLELLSPAGNAEIGMAAVDHGADAVYIGAPAFSARAAAGNTIADITRLIRYARPFAVKVFVALNTILTDAEIPPALEMIHQIHAAGADGLIIQDVGLLECDLPPLPLIASTQMHNATLEKVKFLEAVGFSRVILARELSLEEIREIRAQTSVELECFVYGALCVSYSGRCYLSQATTGRSGNRGVCAQVCRHRYTLMDGDGRPLLKDKYLLSLKDLNLFDALPQLIEAGVTCFKIEGRYKDIGYVKNVTAAFRRQIDHFLAHHPQYGRASSGQTRLKFEPDLTKTFNRGYTRYFLFGRQEKVGAVDTPKSLGKPLGRVTAVEPNSFRLKGDPVRNGDGLCFFTPAGDLAGFRANRVTGDRVYPFGRVAGLRVGDRLYRNHDQAFSRLLEKSSAVRKVGLWLRLTCEENRVRLEAIDADGLRAEVVCQATVETARDPGPVRDQIREQLASTGNTIFTTVEVLFFPDPPGFLPLRLINRLRREVLERLTDLRINRFQPAAVSHRPNEVPCPEKNPDFRANVLNRQAQLFYTRHGATINEPALESGAAPFGKIIMTSRYCLRHQVNACPRLSRNPMAMKEPLALTDGYHHFKLAFDCRHCLMHVYLAEKG